MERIHCAALQVGDVVHVSPLPLEHTHIKARLGWSVTACEGFLTSEGNFVDRLEAGKIALAAGQVKNYNDIHGLISPQLWSR